MKAHKLLIVVTAFLFTSCDRSGVSSSAQQGKPGGAQASDNAAELKRQEDQWAEYDNERKRAEKLLQAQEDLYKRA
jgi:hypothetical protein